MDSMPGNLGYLGSDRGSQGSERELPINEKALVRVRIICGREREMREREAQSKKKRRTAG